MFKHGNLGQGIYVDPGRDVIGVYFSTNGYISPVNDTVVAWSCTSDGSNHEGTMARAIVKRLKQQVGAFAASAARRMDARWYTSP
jgi:hypothetical protein